MSPRRRVTYSTRPTHAARSAHARGEREFRTYDTSYIRPKKSKAPVVVTIALLVVVAALLIWGAISLMNSCSPKLASADEQVTVQVAEGSGAQAIGNSLVSAHLISNASDFTSRVNARGVASSLQPGTYTFAGGTTVDTIIDDLLAGAVPAISGTSMTIPEGFTIKQMSSRVEQASSGRITADQFVSAASNASTYAADYAFLADAGTNSLEGFLFPKTYAVAEDATADSVIRMMLDQFKLETAGLDYSYAASQGLSAYDVVTLASIIEKESTGDEAIRAKVSRVFYNRLTTFGETAGFLQSDATTAYEVGHDPTAQDVATDSAYNTYTNKGLPPTPICAPSIDSLQAACAPGDNTKDYFFYFEPDSSGTMQYYFSETYEDHMSTFS